MPLYDVLYSVGIILCALTSDHHGVAAKRIFDITFVGDSLLRYQYLNFVYAIHFNTSTPPEFLINEKKFDSWTEFYHATSSIFGKQMLCDCFRADSTMWTEEYVRSIRENRYYTSRDGGLSIRYYQRFGDLRSIGMRKENVANWYNRIDGIEYDWSYESQQDLLRKEVVYSDLLIMSAPHHSKESMAVQLNNIILTGREVARDVVWQQVSPNRNDAIRGSYTYSDFDTWVQERNLCHLPSKMKIVRRNMCWYEAFPLMPLQYEDYIDAIHFRNNTIYSTWTKKALRITQNCHNLGHFCFT